MNKCLVVTLAAGLVAAIGTPFAAAAGESQEEGGPRRGLGAGVVATDSPYAGEGARTTPFPLVSYEGEKFFFRGITAGWRFIQSGGFTLGGITKMRLDGFDIDDLGREELALNGLDYRLLEDRDDGFDMGLSAEWSGDAGVIEFELLADATGTSGGYQASIAYGYPIQLGKMRVTPNVGVKWLSDDLANYYYGTLDEEVARGVVDYKPDAAAISHVGIDVSRPIGQKWAILASLEYRALPNGLKASPLIEQGRDDETSLFIGISRGF
ncbi:MipA/OmpV family protein [[Pseudomonas] boreopolis]|uniref:MipA/OmpV family protein n=1 Tax=Xanthomonas boreopolis TaxID=86183 RepID=UPI003D9BE5D4